MDKVSCKILAHEIWVTVTEKVIVLRCTSVKAELWNVQLIDDELETFA